MHPVDLRSDTVTRPTPAMREAMALAEVGDDVYGEDPTVIALQQRIADDLGFDAALWCPTGTQANLVALMAHCARGDEYIVGMEAHTYKYEGGGAAVLGSIQPQPIPQADDGTLDLGAVERAIKPVDPHFARTRLLCLENTWMGRVLPMAYLKDARALCDRRGLALHLDGARLFNAAVASNVAAREIARHFDSVSVCLSKGLGAPAGSVLAGSTVLIDHARRWRKVCGGGWLSRAIPTPRPCTCSTSRTCGRCSNGNRWRIACWRRTRTCGANDDIQARCRAGQSSVFPGNTSLSTG